MTFWGGCKELQKNCTFPEFSWSLMGANFHIFPTIKNYLEKNYPKAIEKYNKALTYLNVATNDESSETESDSENETEKTETDVKCDEKQKEVEDKKCAILLNLSMAYLNNKNTSEAEKAAQRGIQADPNNAKGYDLKLNWSVFRSTENFCHSDKDIQKKFCM